MSLLWGVEIGGLVKGVYNLFVCIIYVFLYMFVYRKIVFFLFYGGYGFIFIFFGKNDLLMFFFCIFFIWWMLMKIKFLSILLLLESKKKKWKEKKLNLRISRKC